MTRSESLRYIKNTNGGATVDNFIDDWNPIGAVEWYSLKQAGLAEVREGKIYLTEAGEKSLAVREGK